MVVVDLQPKRLEGRSRHLVVQEIEVDFLDGLKVEQLGDHRLTNLVLKTEGTLDWLISGMKRYGLQRLENLAEDGDFEIVVRSIEPSAMKADAIDNTVIQLICTYSPFTDARMLTGTLAKVAFTLTFAH